ncbi:MAG TPA: Uma2 family endonuclease [Acidisphaera sp.]|nr:Uma2 family endonuclease [Acidisphaera sp.]
MSDPVRKRMTVDEFIAWAIEQPETEHYELLHGEVVAMAPERVGHALMKAEVYARLRQAIEHAGLDCEAIPDGPLVQVDEYTGYEPDAVVRCGTPIEVNSYKVPDPIIVVEVLSPSTQHIDTNTKLTDYFRIASLRHYLIVRLKPFAVTHYSRGDDGEVRVRLLPGGGTIAFDPPGFAIELSQPPQAGSEAHWGRRDPLP